MEFIASLIRSLFLIFMLLVIAPTILFLTKSYYGHLVAKKTYVGVIELPSIITHGDDLISAAKNLFASSEIRSLILICDSKGGNPGTCLSIQSDLVRLKELYQKPIISFIEKECLNGAYAIATAGDFIVSSPGAIIGNVSSFNFENEDLENIYPNLSKNFEEQYLNILKRYRSEFDYKLSFDLKNILLTGLQAKEHKLVDFCGGKLEVERILRGRTVIEGKIEEVRGSLAEHFVFYITHTIHRIINGIR